MIMAGPGGPSSLRGARPLHSMALAIQDPANKFAASRISLQPPFLSERALQGACCVGVPGERSLLAGVISMQWWRGLTHGFVADSAAISRATNL